MTEYARPGGAVGNGGEEVEGGGKLEASAARGLTDRIPKRMENMTVTKNDSHGGGPGGEVGAGTPEVGTTDDGVVLAADLDGLAARANAEHRACKHHEATAYEHAIRAGEYLIEGRRLLPYGGRVRWLEEKFEGSTRTAYDYMFLAENKTHPLLQRAAKASALSIREALRILKPQGEAVGVPKERVEGDPGDPSNGGRLPDWNAPRDKLVEKYGAERVARLDAVGLGEERLGRVKREEEKRRLEEEAMRKEVPSLGGGMDIRRADFRELEHIIEDGSVDLVATDPPYGKHWLGHWEDLAAFVARKLKDGGFFITYGPTEYEWEVETILRRHLTKRWKYIVHHVHGSKRLFHVPVCNVWKPVFIFSKGLPAFGMYQDKLTGEANDGKAYHKWGQPLSEAEKIIRRFSEPGDLVFDPCVGGGTIPAAAARTGRRIIGSELDEKTYRVAMQRLASEFPMIEGGETVISSAAFEDALQRYAEWVEGVPAWVAEEAKRFARPGAGKAFADFVARRSWEAENPGAA